MFLDKKGMEGELIVGLIALAIIAVIIFLYSSGLFSIITGEADISNCNTWVGLQSKFKVEGVRLIPSDNPCITTVSTIKDKEEAEFYEYMAKTSFNCWDMYGRGKVDFFSDWDFTGIENYCFVCDETTIGEDAEINDFDLDKFEAYLSNNKVSGQKKTYSDIFLGTENSRIDFGEGKIPLKKGDKMYTMFTVIKSDTAPSLTDQFLDTFTMIGENVVKSIFIQVSIVRHPSAIYSGAITGFVYSGFKTVFGVNYMYPSLIIAKGDGIVDENGAVCSKVHFSPKKNIFKSGGENEERKF